MKTNFHKYEPISDFPSSIRDLSFTIFNESSVLSLEDLVLNQKHELLKDVFVFDYFKNPKSEEIKLGLGLSFNQKIQQLQIWKLMLLFHILLKNHY